MSKRNYGTGGSSMTTKRVKRDDRWLLSSSAKMIPISRSWITKEPMTTAIPTHFCKPHLLEHLLESKSALNGIDPRRIEDARRRLDPFGKITRGIFLNRSAIKLANLDYLYGFSKLDNDRRLLYFADLCAGPGGFSDYMLYRRGWKCKGFGFTLKGGDTDFQTDRFLAPESFVPHYGILGDGNIYRPENLTSFRDFVMKETTDGGVDLVLADGGFSVVNRENDQEILSKRLYLCQFLCALMILRPSGHFVCKLFDVFTNFSVGLIYLMYRAFEKISISKPEMSRPCNSERYVVCKYKRRDTKDICDYLAEINADPDLDDDIADIVSLSVLKYQDKAFFDYVYDSNNAIAERQIFALGMMQSCLRNLKLCEPEQNDTRDRYLKLWDLPPCDRRKLDSNRLIVARLKKRGDVVLFWSMGRSNVYRLDSVQKIDANVELPAKTLFWGKLLPPPTTKGGKEILCLTDALFLGGIDVQHLPYEERIRQSQMMARAISKPNCAPLVVGE